MKERIYSLDDPQATDEALVGIKAAQVARLRQTEKLGSPGFVVPTSVYRTAPHGEITPDVEAAIAAAYAQLGDNVPVDIHSSPTLEGVPVVSFDGVTGRPKILNLIEACWQSLTAPQARAYFTAQQIEGSTVGVGVLIQALG